MTPKTTLQASLIGLAAAVILASASADAAYSPDHKVFTDFLSRYSKAGKVDYAAVKADPSLLDHYLEGLTSVTKDDYSAFDNAEKISFWINAYNAAAIKLVSQNYPIKKGFSLKGLAYPSNSIQQIPHVWKREVINLLGEMRSLDEIEHGILRKEFKEPRIHFALVCASSGCPVLRSEAYDPLRLDEQLDSQVYLFLSDTSKSSYLAEEDVYYASKIFQWFASDFGGVEGVIEFIRGYDIPALKGLSQASSVKHLDYSWALNDLTVA